MADQTAQSANPQQAARANARELSLFITPQETATINVGGHAFKVYKALLIKDSDYFERALDGPFVEGQTQTIDLGDDVSPAQFGVYVDVLHHSYVDINYEFHPRKLDLRVAGFHLEPTGPSVSPIRQSLWLWKLSDRFLNKRLLNIAEDAFNAHSEYYSVQVWEERYEGRTATDASLFGRIVTLEKCYHCCVEYNLPQKDELVQYAANMPPQLFTKHYDELDVDFRIAAMKRVLKRCENPNLKRPSEGDDEGAPPATRVRTT